MILIGEVCTLFICLETNWQKNNKQNTFTLFSHYIKCNQLANSGGKPTEKLYLSKGMGIVSKSYLIKNRSTYI